MGHIRLTKLSVYLAAHPRSWRLDRRAYRRCTGALSGCRRCRSELRSWAPRCERLLE
jgi:hypothetical protein